MSWYRDEYLKSDDWKNLRLAILAYQEYICECCGGKATDVHHFLYRKLYDVTHFDLMAVCRDCHDRIHEWLESPAGIAIKQRAMLAGKKKSALMIKAQIANDVSKRGYINFRACFGIRDEARCRISFYSKALQLARQKDKKLKKKLDNSSR